MDTTNLNEVYDKVKKPFSDVPKMKDELNDEQMKELVAKNKEIMASIKRNNSLLYENIERKYSIGVLQQNRQTKAALLRQVAESINRGETTTLGNISAIMGYEGQQITTDAWARTSMVKLLDAGLITNKQFEDIVGFNLVSNMINNNGSALKNDIVMLRRFFQQIKFAIGKLSQSLIKNVDVSTSVMITTSMALKTLTPEYEYLEEFAQHLPAPKMITTAKKEGGGKIPRDFVVARFVEVLDQDTGEPMLIEKGTTPVSYTVSRKICEPSQDFINNLFESMTSNIENVIDYPDFVLGVMNVARRNFYGTGDGISPLIRLSKCYQQRNINNLTLDKDYVSLNFKKFSDGNFLTNDSDTNYRRVISLVTRSYFSDFRGVDNTNFMKFSYKENGDMLNYSELMEKLLTIDEVGNVTRAHNMPAFKSVNMKSDAGFPFNAKRVDVWPTLLERMNRLVAVVNQSMREPAGFLREEIYKNFNEINFTYAKPKAEVFPLRRPLDKPNGKDYMFTPQQIIDFLEDNLFIEKGRIIWVTPSTATVLINLIAQLCYANFTMNYYHQVLSDISEWEETVTVQRYIVSLASVSYVHGVFDLICRDFFGMKPFDKTRITKFFIYSDNVYIVTKLKEDTKFDASVMRYGQGIRDIRCDEEGMVTVPAGTHVLLSMDGAKMETSTDIDWTEIFIHEYCAAMGLNSTQERYIQSCVRPSTVGGYTVYNNCVFEQEFMGSGAWSTFMQNDVRSYSCIWNYLLANGIHNETDIREHYFDYKQFQETSAKFGVCYTMERCTVFINGQHVSKFGEEIAIDLLGFSVRSIQGANPFILDLTEEEPLIMVPVLETKRMYNSLVYNKSVVVEANNSEEKQAINELTKALGMALLGGVHRSAVLDYCVYTIIKSSELISPAILDDAENNFNGEFGTEIGLTLDSSARTVLRRLLSEIRQNYQDYRLKLANAEQADKASEFYMRLLRQTLRQFYFELWGYKDLVLNVDGFYTFMESADSEKGMLPTTDLEFMRVISLPRYDPRNHQVGTMFEIFKQGLLLEINRHGKFTNFKIVQGTEEQPGNKLVLVGENNKERLERVLDQLQIQKSPVMLNSIKKFAQQYLLINPKLRDDDISKFKKKQLSSDLKGDSTDYQMAEMKGKKDKVVKSYRDKRDKFDHTEENRIFSYSGRTITIDGITCPPSVFGDAHELRGEARRQTKATFERKLMNASVAVTHFFEELIANRQRGQFKANYEHLMQEVLSGTDSFQIEDKRYIKALNVNMSILQIKVLNESSTLKLDLSGADKLYKLFLSDVTLIQTRNWFAELSKRFISRLSEASEILLATEILSLRRLVLVKLVELSFTEGSPIGLTTGEGYRVVYGNQQSVGLSWGLKLVEAE